MFLMDIQVIPVIRVIFGKLSNNRCYTKLDSKGVFRRTGKIIAEPHDVLTGVRVVVPFTVVAITTLFGDPEFLIKDDPIIGFRR